MPDAALIVPTRGRRAQLARFLDANHAMRGAEVDVILSGDKDDRDTYDGLTVPPYVFWRWGPRAGHGEAVNRAAVAAAAVYPVVGMAGDDTIPETQGWDAALLSELETPGIAVPVSRKRGRLPEHWFISSPVIRALGWALEPSMRHYWVDVVLHDLGNDTGCARYRDDVQLFHDQEPGQVRPEDDEEADRAAYERWQRYRQAADAATIRRAIDGLRFPGRGHPGGPARRDRARARLG